jgi:dTDP-4-dehydrorhamnose 3,5-epimerase|tara:strand:- start:758 stop:1189 length:432 start_codon:yes stop_codon:yes gene_type:complete
MHKKSYLTKLKVIKNDNGDILHGLKSTEDSFENFGEAYFSNILKGSVKAWKNHKKAVLNLIVISGGVKFVVIESMPDDTFITNEFVCGYPDDYCRLTIPPNTWFGFQGIKTNNTILSISSLPHNPDELERKELDTFNYDWSIK